MTTCGWAYLCVVGVVMLCVDAETSQNATQSAPGANSTDVTTTVSSSTASMDSTSTSAPSAANSTTAMPSSSNESSNTSGQGGSLVPQFVEQPPSFPPPPPPAQFNPVTDGLPDPTNPNVSTTTVSSSPSVMSVVLSSSSPPSVIENVSSEPALEDDATDVNLTTSGNWVPGKFPPPGMPSAADSGNSETTTPTTTPLTVVEVGNPNVPTVQNDEKHKYDVNTGNNAMPNDAPAENQPSSTKDSVMGSTVSYSKEAGSSAQQKTPKGNHAETSRAQLPILTISFLLALVCNSRM